MKLIELKCKNCGATLKVNSDTNDVTCKYCQTSFKLDDEIQHIKYDNMEQSGYEFEKGRIRAQQENKTDSNSTILYTQSKSKNNKTPWLVLAWIFLFPFTATYFIAKSNKLDKTKKIIFIAIMWVLFFIIGIISDSQEKEALKNKIINCYSDKTYNKINEIFGIDNIKSNISSSTTCESLRLTDENYKEIEIKLNDNKELVYIKINNEFKYGEDITENNIDEDN